MRSHFFSKLLGLLLRGSWFVKTRLHTLANHIVNATWFLYGMAVRDSVPKLHCFTLSTAHKPLRMLLNRPGYLEDSIIKYGGWEPHIAQTLLFFMPENGVFVDVGSNIGYHTLFVACSMPQAKVFSFEPNPSVREELLKNAHVSNVTNVVIHATALSDHIGTAQFFAQSANSYNRGISSIKRNSNIGQRFEAITVEVSTLDTVLAGKEKIDVIKIDTEGLELQVLRGARRILAESNPLILFEFEAAFFKDPLVAIHELAEILSDYSIYKLDDSSSELQIFNFKETLGYSFHGDLVAMPKLRSDVRIV